MSRTSCLLVSCLGLAGCPPAPAPTWEVAFRDRPGALISVWGASSDDVWAVGSDAGEGDGPEVWRYDGSEWTRQSTGESGDLWWVHGFAGGPVIMGGGGGMILRYENGEFTRMTTPGNATVFGIWGATADDLWAVGGAPGGASGGFAWRSSGGAWTQEPTFPTELQDTDAIWKVYGRGPDDAWLVGTRGRMLRWDGAALQLVETGFGESLFTVHGNASGYVAVGGFGSGIILESDGTDWHDRSPDLALGLLGVHVTGTAGYAVGQYGDIWRREGQTWVYDELEDPLDESLHAVWIDPDGGAWAVGGQVLSFPLSDGLLLRKEGT